MANYIFTASTEGSIDFSIDGSVSGLPKGILGASFLENSKFLKILNTAGSEQSDVIYTINLDVDNVNVDGVTSFVDAQALYDVLKPLFFLANSSNSNIPDPSPTGDEELISVDGVVQWDERPYTVDGAEPNRIINFKYTGVFPSDSIQVGPTLKTSDIGGQSVDLNLKDETRSYSVDSLIDDSIGNGETIGAFHKRRFNSFVDDPAQPLFDKNVVSSLNTNTGRYEHIQTQLEVGNIITDSWKLKPSSDFVNLQIDAYINYGTADQFLFWRRSSKQQIINNTGLHYTYTGSPIEFEVKLAPEGSNQLDGDYLQNNGEIVTFVVSADNQFSVLGTSIEIQPGVFADYVYILGKGVYWENQELATKESINKSALSNYDLFVSSSYTGGNSDGSAINPYTDVQTAIDNASDGYSILIEGTFIVTSEITIPDDKSLYLYGTDGTVIKYASYVDTNGEVFNQPNTGCVKEYHFSNIDIANSGGYGVYIRSAKEVSFKDCDLYNNGWSGNGLSTVLAQSGSTLGYDSSQVDLQAFWSSSETSDGGAMRIRSTSIVSVVDCKVYNNLRGLRIQDCGVNGYGYISRNQCYNNIESGIYLASGSYNATEGCENFTVYNNASKYNANNGILIIGGINNIASLNIVEGNWNAGVMGWHVSNTRFRDLDLTNNNRSQFNGIGNTADAHASITIGGNTARSNRDYIADILSTEVYNTGLGSNTSRIGFQILEDVQEITDNYNKTLINVDNVGFKKQDYSVDVLADLDIVKLTLGDCRYIETVFQNVQIVSGDFYELPFSNHSIEYNSCNFKVDDSFVIITEGLNGNRINPYGIRDLQAIEFNGLIRVLIKDSNKVQFDLLDTGLYIDDVLVTGTLSEKINQLNALLQNSGGAGGESPVITSSLAISLVEGQTLNYELTADYGVGYEWDFSNVSGIVNVEGNIRKIIGGSGLSAGTYNIPVKSINYNGQDSETIVLTVSTPPFSNTKSIQLNTGQYLGANAALLDPTLGRSGNGSGSGDAWTMGFWVKSTNSASGRILFYYGSNDTVNGGIIEVRLTSSNKLRLQYGSNNNNIRLQSPNSLTPNTWQHVMYTYDGGTTGASSGDLSNYYSRFKLFIDGVQQTTNNSHINFGWSGAISGQNLRVGRLVSGNYLTGEKIDERPFWDSDQSANISDIYNAGVPFDLSTLTTQPRHWSRDGDGDTYPYLQDHGTANNLIWEIINGTSSNIVSDVP